MLHSFSFASMLWRWRKNSLRAVTVISMTMKFSELKWSLSSIFLTAYLHNEINK